MRRALSIIQGQGQTTNAPWGGGAELECANRLTARDLLQLRDSPPLISARFLGGVDSPSIIAGFLDLPCARRLQQFEVRQWEWDQYSVFTPLQNALALRIGVKKFAAPKSAFRWPTPYLGLTFEESNTRPEEIDLRFLQGPRDLSLWFGAGHLLDEPIHFPASTEYAFLTTTESGRATKLRLAAIQGAASPKLRSLDLSALELDAEGAFLPNVQELRLARLENCAPPLAHAFPDLKKLELDHPRSLAGVANLLEGFVHLEKVVLRGDSLDENAVTDLHRRFRHRVFVSATRFLGDRMQVRAFSDGVWA